MTPKPPRKPPQARVTTSGPAHYKVERLDQVRLLAHPLRLKLFEAFAVESRTTHQVARALGLAPTRLYHHVNALERVGLLQLKETRQVRGATEKYYQAVGRMLEIEPDLFMRRPGAVIGAGGTRRGGRPPAGAEAIVAQLVGRAGSDLTAALARYPETPEALRPVATQIIVHGSPAKLAALRRRVVKWIEGCSKRGGRKKSKGAAQGASRASLTLIFTAETGSRSGPG